LEAENTWLDDQWVIDEIEEEIKRFLEVNENENTTYLNPKNSTQKLLDTINRYNKVAR
jgi:hypothetical protein